MFARRNLRRRACPPYRVASDEMLAEEILHCKPLQGRVWQMPSEYPTGRGIVSAREEAKGTKARSRFLSAKAATKNQPRRRVRRGLVPFPIEGYQALC
jgi:hypothetical protein